MWAGLLAYDWTALAVVPTGDDVEVQDVVDALQVATKQLGATIERVDGRGLEVTAAKHLIREIEPRAGRRAVIVVDSLLRSLSGVHLVQGADAILLVVRVGQLDKDALTSTIAMVGHERVVGSVTASVRE